MYSPIRIGQRYFEKRGNVDITFLLFDYISNFNIPPAIVFQPRFINETL